MKLKYRNMFKFFELIHSKLVITIYLNFMSVQFLYYRKGKPNIISRILVTPLNLKGTKCIGFLNQNNNIFIFDFR